MRILIAETDLVLLAEMRQALEDAGYTVITSTDGMRAWDHLVGTSPPHLLVTRCDLGLHMPPGIALGRCAKASRPRIPVIYIPGSIKCAEHIDPEHGTILVKPFAIADLLAAVTTVAHTILSLPDGDPNHARP